MNLAARVIGSILKHDKKVNSYKIALVRAVNDVVLSYPDLVDAERDGDVPLRRLAQQWLAYYWPFMNPVSPVLQGPRAKRQGGLRNDVAFRPALTRLRAAWADNFGPARPSDGFLVVAELRVPRIAAGYPPELRLSFRAAVSAISEALQQPIRYAGPGGTQYHVFQLPRPAAAWADAEGLLCTLGGCDEGTRCEKNAGTAQDWGAPGCPVARWSGGTDPVPWGFGVVWKWSTNR